MYNRGILFAIRTPAGNLRGPQYMQQALASLHQHGFGHSDIRLLYGVVAGEAMLLCRSTSAMKIAIQTALQAQYPDCTLHAIRGDPFVPSGDRRLWSARLRLQPDMFPLLDRRAFDDLLSRNSTDPISSVLNVLSSGQNDPVAGLVEICVRPAPRRARRHLLRAVRQLSGPRFRSHPYFATLYVKAVTGPWLSRRWASMLALIAGRRDPTASCPPDLIAAQTKADRHLFTVTVHLAAIAASQHAALAITKIQALAGSFSPFTVPGKSTFVLSPVKHQTDRPSRCRRRFLLSDDEVAMLWHPPTSTVEAENLSRVESRELPPPTALPNTSERGEGMILGRVQYRDDRRLATMPDDARFRHTFIVGKTGMGKSTLLENLLAADIDAGAGVGLIDPHGDLAETVLRLVPRRRTNDVVLFDVGDRDHPIAFNPLDCRSQQERPLVASAIVSAIHKMNPDSWGPRLEDILRNACLALCEVPGTSLLSLSKMLSDANYRCRILDQVSDPVILEYWHNEFGRWRATDQATAVASVQNKIRPFLSHPILRAIVGQPTSRLDLRRIMDEGKILIVNLSKGRIGEDATSLLGSFIVGGLQQAALSRADVPVDQRSGFHLYVDEFQNFATDSFATILSEARKYRVSLTLANQYLYQIREQSPQTLSAVFGNVGSIVAFQVGSDDAEELARQLIKNEGDLLPSDLTNLPKYTAYLRLLIDGMPSRPFSIATLPPRSSPKHRASLATIRSVSHRRYGRPPDQVAQEIERAFCTA